MHTQLLFIENETQDRGKCDVTLRKARNQSNRERECAERECDPREIVAHAHGKYKAFISLPVSHDLRSLSGIHKIRDRRDRHECTCEPVDHQWGC